MPTAFEFPEAGTYCSVAKHQIECKDPNELAFTHTGGILDDPASTSLCASFQYDSLTATVTVLE